MANPVPTSSPTLDLAKTAIDAYLSMDLTTTPVRAKILLRRAEFALGVLCSNADLKLNLSP